MAKSRRSHPCTHEEVIWDVVEIDYNAEGTAAVGQNGTCEQCGASLRLNYEAGEPRALTKTSEMIPICLYATNPQYKPWTENQ